jgi:hypothetical protein
VFCTKCGTEMPDQSEFWSKCGARQPTATPSPAAPPRIEVFAAPIRARRTRRISILAIFVIAALATGCGSSSSSGGSNGAGVCTSLNACGGGTTATAPAKDPKCNGQIGKWITALQALNSRLNVGLTNAAYTTELGDVSVLYGQIPFKAMSAACLTPGTEAEKAMNLYITASNAWSACISSLTCSNAKVKPKLQRDWAKASSEITKAENELQALA